MSEQKVKILGICGSPRKKSSYLALKAALEAQKTGLGIIEYFSNMKIESAKEMIRTGHMNFTQISEQLGYASIHYFSRQFKKSYRYDSFRICFLYQSYGRRGF